MSALFLDALKCRNKGRAPIWLMRQAGRYLPEYQELRKKHTLYDMFHHAAIIAEVTKQPVDRLGVDAAILFSDILIVLDALGVMYDFENGVQVQWKGEFQKRDVRETLRFVFEAIKDLRRELKVPLIGFAGAPLTIASYLFGTEKELKETKKFLFSEREKFRQMLDQIFDVVLEYVDLQCEAGVQAIQIFDSWAGLFSYFEFQAYSLHYLKRLICERKYKEVPLLFYCRGSAVWAERLASMGLHGISVDLGGDLIEIRHKVGSQVALQGNFDPALFYGSLKEIEKEASRLLQGMRGDKGFIFNLGQGILPDIDASKVQHLIHYVQSF